MLERAVEEGQAPALATLSSAAPTSRLRVRLPVGHSGRAATIATGVGQDEHLIPTMNWYHRGEERYVEYGSSFAATRARSDLPLAAGHGLQHEHRPPVAGRADGVRVARRRRPAHRRHDLPDLPRPPPPRAARESPTAGSPNRPSSGTRCGARASSSTPTSSPPAAPAAAPRSACPASATSTPAASARTWSRTTSSTSCFLAARQRHLLAQARPGRRRSTSIAEADRALERLMDAGRRLGRVPRGPRGDRHVRPLADRRRGPRQPGRGARRLATCCRRPTRRPDEAEIAVCPAAALGAGLRARRGPARRARCPSSSRDLADVDGRRPRAPPRRTARRAVVGRRAASCASRPAATSTDARGGTLERGRATSARSASSVDGRRVCSGAYPDALARLWSALTARRPATCCSRPAPGYEFVDWGGADHVGGGSHGSLHRGDSRGRADHVRDRPRRRPRRAAVVAARRDADGPRPLRRTLDRCRERRGEARRPLHRRVRARACAAATTGCSSSSSARSAARATSSTWPSSRSASSRSDIAPPGRGHARVPGRRDQQLLVEPPLDLRRAARPRRASRPRASSPSAWPRSCSPRRCSSCSSAVAGCPRCRAGDLDRRGHAAQLRREQDVELRDRPALRLLRRAPSLAACALLAAAAAALGASRRQAPRVRRPSRRAGYRAARAKRGRSRSPTRAEQGATERRARRRVCARRLHARARAAGRSSYFDGTSKEVAQVQVDDRTGAVLEAVDRPPGGVDDGARLRGRVRPQAERAVASGSRCASCSSLPFVDPRRPFRMLHLDLLVLLALRRLARSSSTAGEIGVSVPLVYPLLALPAGAHAVAGFRAARAPRAADARSCPVAAGWRWRSCSWSGSASALNVADSNVIDVGYAGVIGADRIADGDHALRRRVPRRTTSTATPTGRSTTSPTSRSSRLMPWSGSWDDLPAAHGAALAFDLLTLLRPAPARPAACARAGGQPLGRRAGLRLGGVPVHAVRARSPTPTTRWWRCSWCCAARADLARAGRPRAARSRWRSARRRKFAPLGARAAVRHGARGERRWPRVLVPVAAALVGAVAPCCARSSRDGGLRELYDRTLGYQAGRGPRRSRSGASRARSARCRRRSRSARPCSGAAGGLRAPPARRRARWRRSARRCSSRSSWPRRTGSTSTSSGSPRSRWWRCSAATASAPSGAPSAAAARRRQRTPVAGMSDAAGCWPRGRVRGRDAAGSTVGPHEQVTDLPVYRDYRGAWSSRQLPYRDVVVRVPAAGRAADGAAGPGGHGRRRYRWPSPRSRSLLAGAVVLLCGAVRRAHGRGPPRGHDRRRRSRRSLRRDDRARTSTSRRWRSPWRRCCCSARTGRALGLAVLGLGGDDEGLPARGGAGGAARGSSRAGERRAALAGRAAASRSRSALSRALPWRSRRRALDAVALPPRPPGADRERRRRSCCSRSTASGRRRRSVHEPPLRRPSHPPAARSRRCSPRCSSPPCALLAGRAWPRRGPAAERALVLASLAAVVAFAALGKVLSPQFLIWVVPARGAGLRRGAMDALAAAVAAAIVLTLLEFPARYFDLVARDTGAAVARGAAQPRARGCRRAGAARRFAGAGRSTCSIDVARPSSPASTSTRVEPRVLVGGLEAHAASCVRKRCERLLALARRSRRRAARSCPRRCM